jgi:hypothetical protein
MFGPNGNPTASNLFEIVGYLQHSEGVRFKIRSVRAASPNEAAAVPAWNRAGYPSHHKWLSGIAAYRCGAIVGTQETPARIR